ncbi:MAG: ABC transporter permease subunit [Legionella sp.]|nr:ABC transporter permease subunit [Legionella sp.]
MDHPRFYLASENIGRYLSRWDLLLLVLIFCVIFFLGWTGKQMATPYHLGEPIHISLAIAKLPIYSAHTVLRLFVALGFSLLFSLIIGTLAAKSTRAEQVIIPLIDILQSIPVLSFLSITITGFIHLFPNSILGPECAAIFVIFTAQVWNITFGFYQALKTLPHDLKEAAAMFQLSPWQCFWKVEVPFSMASVLWNVMMSMSASWFFVVLSETIIVAHQEIRLPGIGSYIALAIEQHNLQAVGYAILTMIVVIFLYDQILFRPLIAWSEKFKTELSPNEESYESWLIDLIRRSHLSRHMGYGMALLKDQFLNISWFPRKSRSFLKEPSHAKKSQDWLWNAFLFTVILFSSGILLHFILTQLPFYEMLHALLLGAATGTRVLVLILLSSLLWIPIGVWIGLQPRLAQKIQPIIQFFAAFPANLFYPLFVIAIVRFHLNVEIWVTPLMILGTQWYILFNVIAGASNIPRDLYLAASNFGVGGWLWWKRLALPGIFPFYITGAITAAGGAWNASIVAEWVSWGETKLQATGLGAYIQEATLAGDFPKIALGTAVMCLYVLLFNHLIWRPLYRLAEARFHYH